MDPLASISPSMVLPPNNLLSLQRRSATFPCSSSSHNHQRYLNLLLPRVASSFADPNSFRRRGRRFSFRANAGSGGGGEDKRAGSGGGEGDDDQEELERALHLDGTIPGTSDEFVKQVSSRAYDMRRHLQQTFDSSSYDAARYCDLLQGGGKGCEGVAEIEASSVFDLCRKMRGLAVLFRRGTTPPMPQSLELNLKARKRSLEDQEEDAA
ncbi:unnamed protein product [Linum tenue]|uniref:Uncharacterized protein n=1 Tax=Linum tenue TaxID=586396 RepID=A0AAV0I075_9ROSI|nr:unnamed protein product [Linum tenue]